MAKIGNRRIDKWLDRTEFIGENILAQIMLRDAPIVVLTLHFGVWELLPESFVRKGHRVCVGFGRQNDRYLGARLSKLRAKFVTRSSFIVHRTKNEERRTKNEGDGRRKPDDGNMKTTEAQRLKSSKAPMIWTESVEEMRQALRDRRFVGFVLDNTSRTRGVACDALAPGFRVLRTPFVLREAEGATLVPMFMYRDRDRLKVEIHEPVGSAEEFGVLARAMIRARPEDWVFWGKRDHK